MDGVNFVIDNRVPQIKYDEAAKALTVVLVECKVGTFSQCSGSIRLYVDTCSQRIFRKWTPSEKLIRLFGFTCFLTSMR